jgi:hypothetical protein
VSYLSTVAFDDFLGYVQAQACAVRAGGKKWFEDMGLFLITDAWPIIFYVDIRLSGVFINAAVHINHDIRGFPVGMIDRVTD